MKRGFKVIGRSFYKAGYWTVQHDGIEHAGYLAFLGLLSVFPFLVFFVAIAGVIGEAQVGMEFVNFVTAHLPEHIISALKPRLNEIVEGPPQGLLTIAIIGVIWTASSAVEGTRTVLNRAYRVETPPAYIWRRLLSIAQFLALTALMILASFLLILAPVIWAKIEPVLGVEHALDPFWKYISYAISGGTIFLGVAISYYILPNIHQNLLRVVPGAVIVLIGWIGASALLSIYLKNFQQVNLVYGSLGGIIGALLFFYVLGVIYIFGAEFNYALERAIGYTFVEKETRKKKKK